MFASQGHSDHARDTEVLIIKFPEAQQLIDDCLLLRETTKFGDVARLVKHSAGIEIATESKTSGEQYVYNVVV
jgi:DNA-directed RNA polymerase subunit H (RpoH/RPB5)